MIREWASGIAVASTVVLAAQAQTARHPDSLVLETGSLAKAGEATRAHLLGSVALYSLALYANGPATEPGALGSPAAAKVLRVVILYEENLHRRIALDWRRELVPRLEAPATAHLQGAFASMREGDVALVEYVPDKGTTIRMNRSVAVTGADHDLMLAFLDHWLGQRPVSEAIKRALLGSW